MDKKIGIYAYARKQSQRCPNKVLRPLGNTTLCDILLDKIKEAGGKNAFFAGYDDEFRDKAGVHGVKFVKRSLNSVLVDEPITECQEFLKRVDFEYLLWVNPCTPFLKVETINKFLEDVKKNGYHPATAVVKRHNYFYFTQGEPVNLPESIKTLNTKTVMPLFEFANALYFFNREYFFKNGRYCDWKQIRLIEINDRSEVLDVDTEDDFMIVKNMWLAFNRQGIKNDKA